MQAQKKSQEELVYTSASTETAYNNQKAKQTNKKQQTLGKEGNLISRVTSLLDSNVQFKKKKSQDM